MRQDESLVLRLKDDLDDLLLNWHRLKNKRVNSSGLDMTSEASLIECKKNPENRFSTNKSYIPNWRNFRIAEKLTDLYRYRGSSPLCPRGQFLYPPGGGMSWHTNNNHPGMRFYFTYVKNGGKSFFRYQDWETKEIITSVDQKGWQVRIFRVDPNRSLWHCVGSQEDRYSVGFGPELPTQIRDIW